MANELTISSVRIIKEYAGFSAPGDEAFDLEAVRFNTATGEVTPANGSTSTEAKIKGLAVNKCTRQGEMVRVVMHALLDVGEALAAMTIGDRVFLSNTDGQLSTVAGTVSVDVGYVHPIQRSTGVDKGLMFDVTDVA